MSRAQQGAEARSLSIVQMPAGVPVANSIGEVAPRPPLPPPSGAERSQSTASRDTADQTARSGLPKDGDALPSGHHRHSRRRPAGACSLAASRLSFKTHLLPDKDSPAFRSPHRMSLPTARRRARRSPRRRRHHLRVRNVPAGTPNSSPAAPPPWRQSLAVAGPPAEILHRWLSVPVAPHRPSAPADLAGARPAGTGILKTTRLGYDGGPAPCVVSRKPKPPSPNSTPSSGARSPRRSSAISVVIARASAAPRRSIPPKCPPRRHPRDLHRPLYSRHGCPAQSTPLPSPRARLCRGARCRVLRACRRLSCGEMPPRAHSGHWTEAVSYRPIRAAHRAIAGWPWATHPPRRRGDGKPYRRRHRPVGRLGRGPARMPMAKPSRDQEKNEPREPGCRQKRPE